MAELEGDAAEDEAEQHGDERRIERRKDGGVGQREDREKADAAEHQPGLVAVPDGGDGIHRDVAVVPLVDQREQHADPEVEAVQHHIGQHGKGRSEEHTSELQSLMRISYAVFCLKKKKKNKKIHNTETNT